MGSEGVVLPAPTIGQDLSLGSGDELLGVEERIAEPTVE